MPTRQPNAPATAAESAIDEEIHLATLEIVAYAEEHPCADVKLQIKILDIRAALEELGSLDPESCDVDRKAFANAVFEAQKALADYESNNRCSNLNLRMKILKLRTRLEFRLGEE